jgi:rhodanese-related sulfurtransferase
MKIYKLFFLLSLVVIISSCGSEKNNSYDNVDQLVSKAQTGIAKVTVAELKEMIDHKNDYKIIDCREIEEFTVGHIPEAVNIPRGLLEFSNKLSNRRETIFIYSLTNDRSSLACRSLKLLKYNKVFLIDGGWQEWNNKFPEIIEIGVGESGSNPAPKVEESGGCGG